MGTNHKYELFINIAGKKRSSFLDISDHFDIYKLKKKIPTTKDAI